MLLPPFFQNLHRPEPAATLDKVYRYRLLFLEILFVERWLAQKAADLENEIELVYLLLRMAQVGSVPCRAFLADLNYEQLILRRPSVVALGARLWLVYVAQYREAVSE